jgi:hypothetical protein
VKWQTVLMQIASRKDEAATSERIVIPGRVAIGLGDSGNRPRQWQGPWKYIEAAPPIENSSKSSD